MELISRHNGRIWGKRRINDYEIWRENGKKFVKISLVSVPLFEDGKEEKEQVYTLVDYDQFDKIKKVGWYLGGDKNHQYVQGRFNKKTTYLHHVITNFEGKGRGFQDLSIDHINRDRLDNRLENLRFATCKEQQQNSKGQIEGTKRTRNYNARKLPEGIEKLPKYIIYYSEKYGNNGNTRDFFRIEKHPKQKTVPPILVNKWATSKSIKISIQQKLDQAIEKLKELDQTS